MKARATKRWLPRAARAGAPLLLAALLLGACGSTPKRGSGVRSGSGAASSSSAASEVTQETTTQPPSSEPQTVPSTTTTSQTGGTEASTTETEAGETETRTATAPAFTEEPSTGPLSLSGAEQVLADRGYSAIETAGYRTEQELSVLIGRSTSNPEDEQAFFFSQGGYLGTDASEPSRSVGVVGRSGSEITLAYGLFNGAGESAGISTVTFTLVNGKLEALEPIPPASSRQ